MQLYMRDINDKNHSSKLPILNRGQLSVRFDHEAVRPTSLSTRQKHVIHNIYQYGVKTL